MNSLLAGNFTWQELIAVCVGIIMTGICLIVLISISFSIFVDTPSPAASHWRCRSFGHKEQKSGSPYYKRLGYCRRCFTEVPTKKQANNE